MSEAQEPQLSGEDAAELEELRREASVLRDQLENAMSAQGGARSARDVHQLEARIDSLASRNAKLMDTLKEARQQLLALREEVDRLGQPPSGYGVLLAPTRTTPSTCSPLVARCDSPARPTSTSSR